MKDNPSVSILVPVYKVEQYLVRCIDSVLAQDFTDWELILVDDGSPDRCPEICDEYAQKDRRIRVVHKENGGLPSARLAGFKEACGRYMVFLDSDDWLMPNALSVLYAKICEGYDIVRGRNYMVFDDGIKKLEKPKLAIGELNSADEYFGAMINATMSPYLWGAMYRRDLFSTEVFKPIMPISIGEDWMTNLCIAKHVNRVCLLDDIVYCYYINSQSMMHQKICSREYSDYIEQTLLDVLKDCPMKWSELVKQNRMIGRIYNFFCPELGFDKNTYALVRDYLSDKSNFTIIKSIIKSRYLFLIGNEILYRTYTFFYRQLFLHYRLKGNCRHLLKIK